MYHTLEEGRFESTILKGTCVTTQSCAMQTKTSQKTVQNGKTVTKAANSAEDLLSSPGAREELTGRQAPLDTRPRLPSPVAGPYICHIASRRSRQSPLCLSRPTVKPSIHPISEIRFIDTIRQNIFQIINAAISIHSVLFPPLEIHYNTSAD